ncbi:hypothetical protein PAMC26577_13725 [Caballeronia sordidicola]|uniref:Uncharacterized protein n=1 Tax=Caballeronia sordidicola TaxID=196367 RepID=A0A242MV60_CABSO|nr:hypothetical protein PAMC26577_13725 [Caballeronia sordidicola]
MTRRLSSFKLRRITIYSLFAASPRSFTKSDAAFIDQI